VISGRPRNRAIRTPPPSARAAFAACNDAVDASSGTSTSPSNRPSATRACLASHEDRRAWLVRSAVAKTKASSWGVLSDDLVECDALVDVLLGRLPAREDRDLTASLFAVGQERLRMAIARAWRDAGVPVFSPHDLRHRRISLLHRQGVDWARIGARVGQRNIAVTANINSHVLLDPREVDWPGLLARARVVHTPVHTR
jgi:hypothetical protein